MNKNGKRGSFGASYNGPIVADLDVIKSDGRQVHMQGDVVVSETYLYDSAYNIKSSVDDHEAFHQSDPIQDDNRELRAYGNQITSPGFSKTTGYYQSIMKQRYERLNRTTMRFSAVSLLFMLLTSVTTYAQLEVVVDSLEYAQPQSDTLGSEWTSRPWIHTFVTVHNGSSDDLLCYTMPKKHSHTPHKEVNLMVQLEYMYNGTKYRNRPQSIWAVADTMYFTEDDFIYDGLPSEALVLKPMASLTWDLWLEPFKGTDIPNEMDPTSREVRFQEWNRLCGILDEIINTVDIRIYTEEQNVL